jgi:integrase/recombinase XerD
MQRQRQADATARFLRPGESAQYLDGFTRELETVGYSKLTILGYAMSIAHFATWARRKGLDIRAMNAQAVVEFASHRCRCPGTRRWERISAKYGRRVRRFVRYLERQGVVPPCERQPRPSLPEFRVWLAQHRGASARTIEHYEGLLLKLLPADGDVAGFTAARVRQLVLDQARRHSRSQTRCIVTALRAYLRFLASKGRCSPGLDRAIPPIPQWRLSTLPRYLPQNEVERVIDSCNVETAVGLRDRAVLLLLARLGLRGGDIVRMRLADIDWPHGTITVCGKGRREVRLPLPQDAGDAVLAYLRKSRPRVAIPDLFLCMQAPYRSMPNSGTVSSIVSAALRRAGIVKPPSRGANLLRHSAATAMLRAGASLGAVSGMLRHRSVDMTAHYAKVDVAMLMQVVQPWPEGTPC